MKLLVLLFLFFNLVADDDYSLRVAVGTSSSSDFDQLYTFTGFNTSPYDTEVYGVEGGYRVIKDMFEWPFDIYVKGGVNYFYENGYQDDFLEATLYVKIYYKLNAFSNQFRLGIAEGVSYAFNDIGPWVEHMEAVEEKDGESHFLNYMEITLDFDMGKLFRVKSLQEVYLGYLIKHRSGFHGFYGGVKDGGSNYNCVYIEKNF